MKILKWFIVILRKKNKVIGIMFYFLKIYYKVRIIEIVCNNYKIYIYIDKRV